jgi:PBP4 family serine-type D-alanyl-D-alanine carboxypeptidase
MLKQSDNFAAEVLLKLLGARVGGAGTSAAGANVVLRTLADVGIETAGMTIVDGSGLSQQNRVSVRSLVELLVRLRSDSALGPVIADDLPLAGIDGTLRHRLLGTPLSGLLHAKSGTTDKSSGLAGNLGNRYAFALIENGVFVPASSAHAAQDRFLKLLARSRPPQ